MKNIIKTVLFLSFGSFFLVDCSNTQPKPVEIGANEMAAAVEAEMSDEIVVTQSQFEMAKMQLGQLAEYNFPTTIKANGIVEVPSKNHTKVSAYAGGYVTHINLVQGERVKKGQVLFTLENPEFVQMQQDYLEAKERLTYLQSDYERQKTLANENVVAQKKFLKAESEYRVTLTKMEGMKKRLSLLNISTDNISAQNLVSSISIKSPASGYITDIHAMKGMFLDPTDVALGILNTDHIHLELNVFEKDILKIKKGQTVTFRIPNANAATYQAEVYLVGKTVDAEKRVIQVHAHLKNKKDKAALIAGMFIDAEIVTEDHPTKGVPESAIVSEEEQDYVLISKGKKDGASLFEKMAVSVGQKQNGFAQILNSKDFSGKEQILIEGAFNLIGIE